MINESGLPISKPTALVHKPMELNLKEFSKALGKGGIDLLFGKWDSLAGDGVEALSALGLAENANEKGWWLVFRSLLQAIKNLVDEKTILHVLPYFVPEDKHLSLRFPHIPLLKYLRGNAVKRTENLERWEVPRQLEQKMIEIARQFRKEPTRSEAILWQALRKKQLAGRKFRRQQPIGRFIVDFFCASERLIVEVDGGIHESQKDLDEQRQQVLESLGLRFVRVSSEEVERNLPEVLSRIRGEFGHPHPPLVSS